MILGIDSSGKTVSVAIYDEKTNKTLTSVVSEGTGNHSVTLLPTVDKVLEVAGKTLDDVTLGAVTAGPGSFTGVRIGISLAKGLFGPRNIPVSPVSSCLAAAYNCEYTDKPVVAVSDARRERFYFGIFVIKDGKPVRLCEDDVLHYSAIAEMAEKEAEKLGNNGFYVTGDGCDLFLDLYKGNATAVENKYIDAKNICKAASYNTAVSPDELAPVYLRLSQAERELKGIKD